MDLLEEWCWCRYLTFEIRIRIYIPEFHPSTAPPPSDKISANLLDCRPVWVLTCAHFVAKTNRVWSNNGTGMVCFGL